MRYLKRILLFLGIAIILQLSVLFYIEKFYLGDKKDSISKTAEQTDKKDKLGKVQVPKGAENPQISWDGRYISYYENAELKVVDTETLEVSKMKFENNTEVSIYKWVKDKNRIILGGKQEDKFKSIVNFAYLDLKEKDNYKPLGSITMPDKKSEVGEIECSSSEDEIYIKLNSPGNRNSIYKLNGKKTVQKLQLKGFTIGNMEVLKQQNKLLYEDSALKKVYAFVAGKTIDIKTIGEARLLSVDKNDNIYVAQLQNNRIKKIYWGNENENFEKWNSKLLNEDVDIKDIKLTPDGKLYINNDLRGSVVDVDTGKELFYKGNFLQLYADGVASMWGENLIKTKFE